MIDHQTYEATIRKPWSLCSGSRSPECDGTGQCKQGRCDGEPFVDEPIPSDFADLDETKHETEGAALFIAGVAIVAILACGGLWLSLTFGGPL